MQAAGLAGVTAAFFAFHLSPSQALAIVAAVMFVVVGDQVSLPPRVSSASVMFLNTLHISLHSRYMCMSMPDANEIGKLCKGL